MALATKRKHSQTIRQNYSPDALNENTSCWKAGEFTMSSHRSRSLITLSRTTNLSKTNRKTISKIATGKQRNSSPLWTHFGFFVSSKRCQVVFSGNQKSASQNHALHACSWSAMTRKWTKLTVSQNTLRYLGYSSCFLTPRIYFHPPCWLSGLEGNQNGRLQLVGGQGCSVWYNLAVSSIESLSDFCFFLMLATCLINPGSLINAVCFLEQANAFKTRRGKLKLIIISVKLVYSILLTPKIKTSYFLFFFLGNDWQTWFSGRYQGK